MEDFTCRSTNPKPTRSGKRPDSWSFKVVRVEGDLYALFEGGEISLGTVDEVKAHLQELIGGFHGLGRTAMEGD